ncbi:hypothetical protein AB0467_04595 [Streptomyces sp. NPDC052095]|uniref:hypothetical protein n=1 Tax=unclassified Streptomyces TaxID=2593676 RepID=UPI00344E10FE
MATATAETMVLVLVPIERFISPPLFEFCQDEYPGVPDKISGRIEIMEGGVPDVIGFHWHQGDVALECQEASKWNP